MNRNEDEVSIEEIHKEIDLIQSCITRMAQNSFMIKGYSNIWEDSNRKGCRLFKRKIGGFECRFDIDSFQQNNQYITAK